jgi:hypothetical protein
VPRPPASAVLDVAVFEVEMEAEKEMEKEKEMAGFGDS